MSQTNKNNDLFYGLNFFMQEPYSFFPINSMMSSGMKFMEDASDFSKDFLYKGMEPSNFFSIFQNTAEVMTSSYADYMGIMGFISKETYDQLIKKYNDIQSELNKHKKQNSQKETKIKNQDKKIKAFEKQLAGFEKKVKDLETELAAEKLAKAAQPAAKKKK